MQIHFHSRLYLTVVLVAMKQQNIKLPLEYQKDSTEQTPDYAVMFKVCEIYVIC